MDRSEVVDTIQALYRGSDGNPLYGATEIVKGLPLEVKIDETVGVEYWWLYRQIDKALGRQNPRFAKVEKQIGQMLDRHPDALELAIAHIRVRGRESGHRKYAAAVERLRATFAEADSPGTLSLDEAAARVREQGGVESSVEDIVGLPKT